MTNQHWIYILEGIVAIFFLFYIKGLRDATEKQNDKLDKMEQSITEVKEDVSGIKKDIEYIKKTVNL